MGRTWCASALVVLSVTLLACDSQQPAKVGERTVSLSFAANNLAVPLYNVWDVVRDKNCEFQPGASGTVINCDSDANCPQDATYTGLCRPDGQPDDFIPPQGADILLVCEQALDSGGQPAVGVVDGPWQHSVRISVIPAGSTTETPLTSTAATSDTANLTPYDDSSTRGRTCPRVPNAALPCPDPLGRFTYTNPRRLSVANRVLLENAGFLATCGGTTDLGDPRIDGQFPLTFSANAGDTVIVRARKALAPPPGFVTNSQPNLSGRLFVDGREISVDGVTSSTSDPGAGVSFSFTVR